MWSFPLFSSPQFLFSFQNVSRLLPCEFLSLEYTCKRKYALFIFCIWLMIIPRPLHDLENESILFFRAKKLKDTKNSHYVYSTFFYLFTCWQAPRPIIWLFWILLWKQANVKVLYAKLELRYDTCKLDISCLSTGI